MKILLATDGSDCSDEAIEEVARRPWPEASELRVVASVEAPAPMVAGPFMLSNSFFVESEEIKRKAAGQILERAAARLRESEATRRLALTTEVLKGPPRQTIVEEAERWGADLVVVGSHGYRSWERMLLGSVSQSVAAHAPCAVEIVRCRG